MAKKSKSKHSPDSGIEEFTNKGFNWFPGHMMKALKQIKEHLPSVDIVLEIRDARCPLATSNKAFFEYIGNKNHLIVINKTNLANPKINEQWMEWFSKQDHPFVFVNCLDGKALSGITKLAKDIILKNHLQSNPDAIEKKKLKMMIIGLPNTGKSTLINRLAHRDASKVADRPGQTQHQLWVKAANDLEILDTPGIMPPAIKNQEQAYWLSAIHAIPERIANYEDTACYLIKFLLKTNPEVLTSRYKIEKLGTDYLEILNQIGVSRGCIRLGNEIDYERVYKVIINDFRAQELGLINLELPPK